MHPHCIPFPPDSFQVLVSGMLNHQAKIVRRCVSHLAGEEVRVICQLAEHGQRVVLDGWFVGEDVHVSTQDAGSPNAQHHHRIQFLPLNRSARTKSA
jgi:hypothetical protein